MAHNKDLIEAEEIKKRWQEYTEELYKKAVNGKKKKKLLMTWIAPMVQSLMQSQTSRSVKASGP